MRPARCARPGGGPVTTGVAVAAADRPGPAARRREAAMAGHRGDEAAARRLLSDPDPAVRGTAWAALERMGALTDEDLRAGLADEAATVRRRCAELAARHPG
ncbi:MAG TPA: hypothetical protein VE990_06930, partial [Acidimicrobiales bacterium]|nr:hypothetical protein [Acidimicrobiales bacterium]